MNFKLRLLIFLLLSANLFFINSKELTLYGNYIKLVVKDDARFNLLGRNSINNPWTPILYQDTNPTNYFRFFSQNKEIPFSKGGIDRFSDFYIKDNKINYYWYDSNYRIEVVYTLISENSDNANSLIIDLTVKSNDIRESQVDYYLCLDTYLGEKNNEHFILQDDFIIKRETKVDTPENLTKISSLDKTRKFGVNVFFGKDEQVAPSLVFFANWRKVEKTVGIYTPVDNLSFDLMPSSINDSALFIEYHNQNITPKNQMKYKFIIGMESSIAKDDRIIKNIKPKDINDAANAALKNKDISSLDIKDLLELLDKMNQKLESGIPLKEDEVVLLNKVLNEIKKKKGQ